MPRRRTKILQGIDVSPGIAVGLVYLATRRAFEVPRLHIRKGQVEEEIERFRGAVERSITQLRHIRSKLVHRRGQEPKGILDAHIMMLRDVALLAGTENLIAEDLLCAEWALSKNIANIRAEFNQIEHDYFKERRSDVEFVGERVQRNLLGLEHPMNLPDHQRVIVVGHDLSPGNTASLDRNRVAGLAIEVGGKTCHTSIMARALELPAVVGVEGLLSEIGSGDRIIVDGYRGLVIVHPSEQVVQEALERSRGLRDRAAALISEPQGPTRTTDGHSVLLSANIEMVEEIPAVIKYGGEAVGLFRTDLLFMRKRPPSESIQVRCYQKLLRQMHGRPVTIRTLDLGGDKEIPFLRTEPEFNPALGLRSIRLTLRMRGLFRTQLRALLRASATAPLKILFPMVSCPCELQQIKELLQEVMDDLKVEGEPFQKDVRIGIMIEVPSAAFLSDILAKEVDFFSIGTNDLIQYTLAVDRHNEQVAYLYDPLHLSILRILVLVVDNAHRTGIPVSLCGEMAGDPLYLPLLMGLGLDEISMSPMSLPYARHILCRSSFRETKDFFRGLMRMTDAASIRREVQAWMAERFPEFFTPDGRGQILGGI